MKNRQVMKIMSPNSIYPALKWTILNIYPPKNKICRCMQVFLAKKIPGFFNPELLEGK
jgi:hypothetical protein